MNKNLIALRIFNNANWIAVLGKLESKGYLWASKDKPTSMFQGCDQGSLFIDLNERVITMSPKVDANSNFCGCYIKISIRNSIPIYRSIWSFTRKQRKYGKKSYNP
jgi:hypothetical protein